jgi:uncharacterized protein YqhQ
MLPALAAYAPIGGQAVIEGVMIRSPRKMATAVRRGTGLVSVRVEPFLSILKRSRFLRLPIIRGAAGLVESMALGIRSLAFSAEEAARDEPKPEVGAGVPNAEDGPPRNGPLEEVPHSSSPMGRWAVGLTILLSLGLGFLIFFYVPLLLTELTGVKHSIGFNVIDGVIRLAFLLIYLKIVGLWGEMRRLFEFHGAEHKAIHNFESGLPLTPETAAAFSRLHPRCGTAFLLTVMLASIVVFSLFGRPEDLGDRLARFSAIPLIGGLAFEAIRFSGRNWDRGWVRAISSPGLYLQNLTTREPDLEQLAVAIRAVESVVPLDPEDQGEVRVM